MTKNTKVALAAVVAVLLVLALVLFPFGRGNAQVAQAEHCTDLVTAGSAGWSQKVDVDSEAPVPVTADPGFLIDSYCVKAGNPNDGKGGGAYIVPVVPPATSVTITHPTKPGVSHYVIHQIPATPPVTDVCPNIDGPQAEVPGGMIVVDGQCVTPTTSTPTPTPTPEVPVTPETPTETPTVPTETPVTPETPETEGPCEGMAGSEDNDCGPNGNPNTPDKDKDEPVPANVQVTECVDNVFVTTVNGEVVSESGTCDEDTSLVASTPAPAQEEGL